MLHTSGSVPPRPLDYFGKTLSFADLRYHGEPLVFMQGGAYGLSRRAATALHRCRFMHRLGECPTRHFNHSAASVAIRTSCTSRQVDEHAEDLWAGVCMREANISATAQPCMLTLGGTPMYAQPNGQRHELLDPVTAARNAFYYLRAFRARRSRCPCPISVHPLKGNASMMALRAEVDDACAAFNASSHDWHAESS